jgi:hypothetical protein
MEDGHIPLAWLNPSIPSILARPGAARITWRVNLRIICRREALERASDVEGRRRRLDCGYCA